MTKRLYVDVIEYIYTMELEGYTYYEIQSMLKKKYGVSMSLSTISTAANWYELDLQGEM